FFLNVFDFGLRKMPQLRATLVNSVFYFLQRMGNKLHNAVISPFAWLEIGKDITKNIFVVLKLDPVYYKSSKLAREVIVFLNIYLGHFSTLLSSGLVTGTPWGGALPGHEAPSL